jgi:hypothetical protein
MPYLVIAVIVVAFCVLIYRLHADHQKERDLLICRIQTPQLAPILAPAQPPPKAEQTYDEGQEIRTLVHGENGTGE